MKRRLRIFLAIMSLMPFYVMVWKWSGRNTNYRNARGYFLNEPRRESRPDLPYDVGASPEAPYIGVHGGVEAATLEVSVGKRHIVLNMPWAYAFLIVGILPASWMIPVLLLAYRRRRHVSNIAGESIVPSERVVTFVSLLLAGLLAGAVIFFMLLSRD